jgi:hypothetical protein
VVRAVSSEGFGRIKYHTMLRGLLDTDRSVRAFMEGDTTELPAFYHARIRRDLGPLYSSLPQGAIMHDQQAYLKSTETPVPVAPVPLARGRDATGAPSLQTSVASPGVQPAT